ncbi:MAG: 3-oxoacyl-[acyl-carrier-protein] reductase [Simkaniaceae bacterium]|nr:3-oxoacyl-[acyl-carrier-protein] reductase [Simkaniaceae bacterium]
MKGLLKEKRTLVTGGSSGLGRRIAVLFAEQGASVAIFGTNGQRLEEAKGEIGRAGGGDVVVEKVDVSRTDEVRKACDCLLGMWGGVDVLVNCAGITRDGLLLRMEEEDWDCVIDINLKSVYSLCRALVKPMVRARSGKIINVASVVGLVGNPGQTNYAASKAGMVGFTRSLAKELGRRDIRVNCIAPGFFATPMTDSLSDEQREEILRRIPMGRFGDPEELARVALFLASDLSGYITGQVLTVDGGMTA